MAWRDWLLPWNRAEKRELSLDKFRGLGLVDPPTVAGVAVSERTALTLPAYLGAVNLISSAVAKLPRKVYRKNADDSREEASGHAVGWLVQTEPNEVCTPFVFWRTMMGHVLTWGNGYAEIERDRAHRPIALLTVQPDSIEPVVEQGVLHYRYKGSVRIPAEDVLHVSGLGFDGIKGYSVVQMARQSLGLGMAAERYGGAFFGNYSVPGLMLEHPGVLTADAQKRLIAQIEARHQGPDRAYRTMIAEEGMKAHVLSVPAKDAQLVETRQLGVDDIARLLNLNPAFLGKSGERPGGNYESGRLDFLDNTLDPWLVAIEQEINRKLISSTQRGTYYVEHVRAAVLRTDATTRANVQKTYVDMGAMTPEYVAKLENLPPPPPKPAPVLVAPPPPMPMAEPDGIAQRAAWRRIVVDVTARMVRLEADRARRAASQGPEKFAVWAEEFYPQHEVRLREALEPVVRGWCEMRGRSDWQAMLSEIVSDLVERSRDELLGAKAIVLEADVDARVTRWERERPDEAARMILEAT